MAQRDEGLAGARVLDREEVESVLKGAFYTPGAAAPAAKEDGKPTHYKVICISMYTKDLEKLDEMVDALKKKGLTKANRSALIRAALDQVDLERVPKGM
jgi:methylmalonyl-CoA mutase cobalamin-binding subunit